jgi:hypothetical protein
MIDASPHSGMGIMSTINSDPLPPSAVVAKQPFSQANLLITFIFTYNCFHRSVILFVIGSEKFPPSASRFCRAFIPDFFRLMT